MGNENSDSVEVYKPVRFHDAEDIKKASAEARLTEEDIRARIKAREEEGYAKGHTAGFEKGLRDGEEELRSRLGRCESIITELENFRERKTEELLPDMIELSLEIAKKIVHKEIELDKDVILHVARDAIRRVGEKEESITIKINPVDYEVIIANMDILKEQSGVKNVVVEPVASVSPGGCYIETRTGEIDARVEEQMKEIRDVISTASDT